MELSNDNRYHQDDCGGCGADSSASGLSVVEVKLENKQTVPYFLTLLL